MTRMVSKVAIAGLCVMACLISVDGAANADKKPKVETYITCYSGSACGVLLYLYPDTKTFSQEGGTAYSGTYEEPDKKTLIFHGTGSANTGCVNEEKKQKGEEYVGEVRCPNGSHWPAVLTKVKG